MQFHKTLLYTLGTALLLAACGRSVTLNHLLHAPTPYEKYRKALQDVRLDQTALGRDWLEAGAMSLHDSLAVPLPYQETGYFAPEKPEALTLRYAVLEGQYIQLQLQPLAQTEATYFLDVFAVQDDSSLEVLHSSDSLLTLEYEVEESGWHAVRIQPELLRGGPFICNIRFRPSLAFPVSGRNSKAVGSFFGADRDGGARRHKGIDIFAPKGTPVLAAAPGVVGRATENRLGGKVVWLNSLKKRYTQYYAHLDSQTVRPGQRVEAGDTLGFVGNTGNARTTPPHLHFSIYKFGRGAVDPYPFVHQLLEEAPPLSVDSAQVGIAGRIKASQANVRQSPSTDSGILHTYSMHTLLQIHGKTDRWYRVSLPDARQGFIHDSLVESLEEPLDYTTLSAEDTVYTSLSPEDRGFEGALAAGESAVLAAYDSLWYVQTPQGYYGWVEKPETLQQ